MPALEVLALDTATPQIRAPGGSDTYTFPRAITPPGANVTPITVSGYSLTGSNAQSMFDLSGTWNTTGTPTGIKFNITDTASNAASLLMDLQVGGSSKFRVSKANAIAFSDTTTFGTLNFIAGSGAASGMYFAGGDLRFYVDVVSAKLVINNSQTAIKIGSGYSFGWGGSQDAAAGSLDLALARDAANTLAQRNGVNWQAFRIYSTYTDASNYDRFEIRQSGASWFIGSNSAGTGPGNRNINIAANGQLTFGANGGTNWFINVSGNFLANSDNTYDIGATGASRPRNVFWAGYQEMSEMTAPAAPAANNVRIYAEDNGSGKTRLMALFATGAAQQIAIEP